jgi:hypothetical protein
MSISYSALNNYGAVTLPSVDSWGTNMNIQRDPPKSITTRKIDKVGDTNLITEMIGDSGDRTSEVINVFGRGINPSVSVSYSNYGNNGGQRSGGLTAGGQTHAFHPYTIIRDGAFRPPIRRQEDLLPLSRMPRNQTSAYTQPGIADFSRKIHNPGTAETTREVKTNKINTCVRPTAVYKIEAPLKEPFEVKYVIQPSIKTSVTSGVRTMDITTQNVQKPTKEISENMIYAFAQSNAGDIHYVDNNIMDTNPYIQETNHQAVVTNPCQEHMQIIPLEDILDLSSIKVQDLNNVNYQTQLSGVQQNNYIHNPLELSKNLPGRTASTNLGKNIYKQTNYENNIELSRNNPQASMSINPTNRNGENTNEQSRNVYLTPKIQPGGYNISSNIPMTNRMQNVQDTGVSEKSRMARLVSEQHRGRYIF